MNEYKLQLETTRKGHDLVESELAQMRRRWWLMPFTSTAYVNLMMLKHLFIGLDIAICEASSINNKRLDKIQAELEKLTTPRQPIPKPDSYYIELFDGGGAEWAFVLYRVNQSGHSDSWSASPLDESDHGQKFEWHPTAQEATTAAVALLDQVKKADAERYAKWAEEDKEEEEKWK